VEILSIGILCVAHTNGGIGYSNTIITEISNVKQMNAASAYLYDRRAGWELTFAVTSGCNRLGSAYPLCHAGRENPIPFPPILFTILMGNMLLARLFIGHRHQTGH
jgi:hypothetical protein